MVCLSGGIDSAACVHYFLSEGCEVEAIFVDYGQKAVTSERSSAEKIARHYNVGLKHITADMGRSFSEGDIQGRNALLIFASLMSWEQKSGIVALGIHSGTPYYDCSEDFTRYINKLLEGYTDGRFVFQPPFLKWDKKMVVRYCKENGVPLDLAYSCEKGSAPPCGTCASCKDRRALNVS